jgi:hypothetical protein
MRGEQLTEIHAGENKIKSRTRCCHASRKQLTRTPLTGGWRDAAATYAPPPFVAPELWDGCRRSLAQVLYCGRWYLAAKNPANHSVNYNSS